MRHVRTFRLLWIFCQGSSSSQQALLGQWVSPGSDACAARLESSVGRVEGLQTSTMLVDEHHHGQRRAAVVGDVTTIPFANDVKAVTDVSHQGHPRDSSFQMPLLLQQLRFTRSIGGFLHRLSHKLNSSTALRRRGCAFVYAMFLICPGSRLASRSCE